MILPKGFYTQLKDKTGKFGTIWEFDPCAIGTLGNLKARRDREENKYASCTK